jgi:hypothetical protein
MSLCFAPEFDVRQMIITCLRGTLNDEMMNHHGRKKIITTSSMLYTTGSNASGSNAALRQLFGWIKKQYGGNIPMEQNPTVITVPSHRDSDNTTSSNSNKKGVRYVDRIPVLQSEDLVRLLQHDPGVIAIHVQGFYHRESALQIGKQLILEATNGTTEAMVQNWNISTNRGLESSDVTTIGAYQPYNIVVASDRRISKDGSLLQQREDEYFNNVQKEHYQRRNQSRLIAGGDINDHDSEPFLWPLDLLRLQLDEAWPSGAGLARRYTTTKTSTTKKLPTTTTTSIQNPPYGGGLPRIMYGPTRYTKGFIHVDEMGPLQTHHGLFSANIYLHLPDQIKGVVHEENSTSTTTDSYDPTIPQEVLEIWPTRIMNRWDWYRNMLLLSCLSSTNVQDQIRLRHELGCEPIRIAVLPGDLVVFCVQRPHAAMGFRSGTRVSLQCFLQHDGIHRRLMIDS